MKFLSIFLLLSLQVFATQNVSKDAIFEVPKNMSTSTKKKRFYFLVVPQVQKVYDELNERYKRVLKDINKKNYTQEIQTLKKQYKAKSDTALLAALKPHPKSITIAQAAIESAWGTSRFFVEAKNVFGMWSADPNEPRIAAGVQRDANKTIWLRKFNSIEDSVREYYKLTAKGKYFKEFRKIRSVSDDPYEIITRLDGYSEIGNKYVEELARIIDYNKLTKYD